MSSRRDLKKIINSSFEYLYEDCLLYSIVKKNANFEKSEALMQEIAKSHRDLLSRLSISEGKDLKERTTIYYKKLKDDFKTQINTLGAKLQALD